MTTNISSVSIHKNLHSFDARQDILFAPYIAVLNNKILLGLVMSFLLKYESFEILSLLSNIFWMR